LIGSLNCLITSNKDISTKIWWKIFYFNSINS